MVEDTHGLLDNIGNSSHRPLLLLALEETRHHDNTDVAELGMGHGSTPYLHRYCDHEKRFLRSFESDPVWASKYNYLADPNMHEIICEPWENNRVLQYRHSVALVDHAPEERRHVDIANLAQFAHIIVIHDTEPQSTGYLLDRIWDLFKFRVDIRVDDGRANASAVSNFFDVTKWKGTRFSKYPYAVE